VFFHSRTKMEPDWSHRLGPGFPAGLLDGRHLVGMIGQAREEGSHDYAGADA
jgi:hypothetical protein